MRTFVAKEKRMMFKVSVVKNTNRTAFAAVVLLLTLLMNIASCQNGRLRNGDKNGSDSLVLAACETIRQVAVTGNLERTEELIDSFTRLNLLPPIRADFYRAVACGNKGDMDNYYAYQEKILSEYDKADGEARLRASSSRWRPTHPLASGQDWNTWAKR